MRVRELIERLLMFDPEHMVYVPMPKSEGMGKAFITNLEGQNDDPDNDIEGAVFLECMFIR